jgi:serine/threonine protein kinase
VKLIDFGFATKLDGSRPPVRRDVGTVAYWPPELRDEQAVDGRAVDAWALGILAYVLLLACALGSFVAPRASV